MTDAESSASPDRVRTSGAKRPSAVSDQFDTSRSLRMVVRDVIEQAEERQRTAQGVYYAGAVLQHLVGAKFDCVLGRGQLQHNSFKS
jgi:hypothetical protein